MDNPFIAQIMMWAGTFAPRGWAECHGQLLSISSNTAMFSLVGTSFGGDGRTSFALPDMRGRTPIGDGQSPGGSSYQLGAKGGQETVTLTTAEMPTHNHSATMQGGGPSTVKATTEGADNRTPSTPQAGDYLAAVRGAAIYKQNPSGSSLVDLGGVSGGAGPINVGNNGGSQAHANMQPFQTVKIVIALKGLYPSRN